MLKVYVSFSTEALRVLQTEVYSHAKKWLDALPLSVKVSSTG